MNWSYRPGLPAEEQLNSIEKDFGFDNLRDCKIIEDSEDSGTYYLYIYRNNKTFRVELTEVV